MGLILSTVFLSDTVYIVQTVGTFDGISDGSGVKRAVKRQEQVNNVLFLSLVFLCNFFMYYIKDKLILFLCGYRGVP